MTVGIIVIDQAVNADDFKCGLMDRGLLMVNPDGSVEYSMELSRLADPVIH